MLLFYEAAPKREGISSEVVEGYASRKTCNENDHPVGAAVHRRDGFESYSLLRNPIIEHLLVVPVTRDE